MYFLFLCHNILNMTEITYKYIYIHSHGCYIPGSEGKIKNENITLMFDTKIGNECFGGEEELDFHIANFYNEDDTPFDIMPVNLSYDYDLGFAKGESGYGVYWSNDYTFSKERSFEYSYENEKENDTDSIYLSDIIIDLYDINVINPNDQVVIFCSFCRVPCIKKKKIEKRKKRKTVKSAKQYSKKTIKNTYLFPKYSFKKL